MSIFQALSCKMGFHNWSDWQYVFDDRCEQIGKCEHCQSSSKREMHDFSEWSIEESEERGEDIGTVHGMDTTVTPWTRHKTDSTRKCKHCGRIESNTVYGETIYGETFCQ